VALIVVERAAVWVRCTEESTGALLDKRQVVCATVWWASLELWKAIPQSELDKVTGIISLPSSVRCMILTSHPQQLYRCKSSS
jgi:hypothetical protein